MGCAASLTFSGGRLILEMARDGFVPFGHSIGYVNPKYRSPTNALVLQYTLVVLYLIATPGAVYQFIIAFASWPAHIFFLFIGIGVFILRKREANLARPFKAYSSTSCKSTHHLIRRLIFSFLWQVLSLCLCFFRSMSYCLFLYRYQVRNTHIGVSSRICGIRHVMH
jgi:amino acid transporter